MGLKPVSIGARFPNLLSAARRGEDWAWAELYRDLAPAVLGYLIGRGADDAEDLVGDCFVQVVRSLQRFEGDERDFRAWVFTIAHSRLIDRWRRLSRRPEIAVPTADLREPGPELRPAEPDRDLLQREAVFELLGRLPGPQREVLLLRVVQQFTIRETAAIMGRSEGAVKQLQTRALDRLQRELARNPAAKTVTAPAFS